MRRQSESHDLSPEPTEQNSFGVQEIHPSGMKQLSRETGQSGVEACGQTFLETCAKFDVTRQDADLESDRHGHGPVRVSDVGTECTDIEKSGIVSRFLASVKGQELNECLCDAGGQRSSEASAPRRMSRAGHRLGFTQVVMEIIRRNKKHMTNPPVERDGRNTGPKRKLESAPLRIHVAPARKSTMAEGHGDNVGPTVAQNVRNFHEELKSRITFPGDRVTSNKITERDILVDEQSVRSGVSKNVSALDFACQEVKRERDQRSNKGHWVKTDRPSGKSVKFHSSADHHGRPPERDIPLSISTDSGIGSPTEVAYMTPSAEKNVEEKILEHDESGPVIPSTGRLTPSVVHNQSQSNFPCLDYPHPASSPTVTCDTSNNRLIPLPGKWHSSTSLVDGGRGWDNSAESRLTLGATEIDPGADLLVPSPHSNPNERSSHEAGGTYTADDPQDGAEIGSSPDVEETPGKGEHRLNDLSVVSVQNDNITSPLVRNLSDHIETLTHDTNEKDSVVRILDAPDAVIDVGVTDSKAYDDSLSEITVSNIIKTLVNNQCKTRIHELEETLSSEEKESVPDTESGLRLEDDCVTDSTGLDSTGANRIVPDKPVRRKLTFRNVSIHDVIALADSPNTDRKLKGILKSTSVPALSSSCVDSFSLDIQVPASNGAVRLDLPTSRSVSFNKTHTKNTFSYYNDAFEGEIITEPSKRPSLADVVSQIMRQGTIIDMDDDNSHPYGRDTSLTDLITGKRRDSYKMDAGKMIVWLVLAIMIVGLAGGIIFMSETYNMNHKHDDDKVDITAAETTTWTKQQFR